MNKKDLLKKLEELLNVKCVTEGFVSRESCLEWANKVAPLLKFNPQYYNNFLQNSHKMNLNLSSYTLEPAFRIMVSQLQMAIGELKNDIEQGDNRVNTKAMNYSGKLKYPDKVTLYWLFRHVPVSGWSILGSSLLGMVLLGIALGQTTFIRELIYREKYQAEKEIKDKTELSNSVKEEINSLLSIYGENIKRLNQSIIEEEHKAGAAKDTFEEDRHKNAINRLKTLLDREHENFQKSIRELKALNSSLKKQESNKQF